MKKMKLEPAKRCLFWHRWQLVKDTGATIYSECRKCGARRAVQNGGVYQPINQDWVLGLTGNIETSKSLRLPPTMTTGEK